ncbi:hypothetical protein KI387_044033, partial [Taxus chinensis]
FGAFFNAYSEMQNPESHIHFDNLLYSEAEEYISKLGIFTQAPRLTVGNVQNGFCNIRSVIPDYGEVIRDSFQGVTVWWSIAITTIFN